MVPSVVVGTNTTSAACVVVVHIYLFICCTFCMCTVPTPKRAHQISHTVLYVLCFVTLLCLSSPSLQSRNTRDVELYIRLVNLHCEIDQWGKAYEECRAIDCGQQFRRNLKWNQKALSVYEVCSVLTSQIQRSVRVSVLVPG